MLNIRSIRVVASRFRSLPRFTPPARQIRRYSTDPKPESEFPELTPEKAEELMKNPLIAKLSQSPLALSKLRDTTQYLQEKGYGPNMTMVQQIKLMMDKDVRERMQDVSKTLKDEGIELRQEDMADIVKVLGLGGQ